MAFLVPGIWALVLGPFLVLGPYLVPGPRLVLGPSFIIRGPSLISGPFLFRDSVPTQAQDLSTRTVTSPVALCDVDLNVLKGEMRRLSWAPNGASIHLQTLDPRNGDIFDYIVDLGNGEISLAFGEPAWASRYWARKSSLVAPGLPTLKLEVIENNRRTRPTPFSGGFANGGAQTPDPHNPVDAYEHEVTLWFVGEEIGRWVNGAPMAGDTFGWGPDGSGALAFTDKNGRLTLIDRSKRKVALAGVRDAAFPAWSVDGGRLAWLQKLGRKKFKLFYAVVH